MTKISQTDVQEDKSTVRALVTGATGFIGGHLVQVLAQAGWEVHALSRNPRGQLAEVPQITWHRYDGNYQSAHLAIQNVRPEVVFHLASLFLTDHRPDQVDALGDANLRFGMHLLEAMNKCGVTKLVNTGTHWQHLNNAAYDPVNLYAATKQAFEAIIDYYCNAHSLCAVTLKLFDTYGPGDQRGKLIPTILKAIETDQVLDMTDGLQQINPVHVLDVCSAYEMAAKRLIRPGIHESFGIYAERSMTIREVVAKLEEKQAKTLVARWGCRPENPRKMETLPKLQQLPNWSPKKSLTAF
jgi:nucleoside-diphosphate-sugar epimerase